MIDKFLYGKTRIKMKLIIRIKNFFKKLTTNSRTVRNPHKKFFLNAFIFSIFSYLINSSSFLKNECLPPKNNRQIMKFNESGDDGFNRDNSFNKKDSLGDGHAHAPNLRRKGKNLKNDSIDFQSDQLDNLRFTEEFKNDNRPTNHSFNNSPISKNPDESSIISERGYRQFDWRLYNVNENNPLSEENSICRRNDGVFLGRDVISLQHQMMANNEDNFNAVLRSANERAEEVRAVANDVVQHLNEESNNSHEWSYWQIGTVLFGTIIILFGTYYYIRRLDSSNVSNMNLIRPIDKNTIDSIINQNNQTHVDEIQRNTSNPRTGVGSPLGWSTSSLYTFFFLLGSASNRVLKKFLQFFKRR